MRSIQLMIAPETARFNHMYICMYDMYVRTYVHVHAKLQVLTLQYKGEKKIFSLNWSFINTVNSKLKSLTHQNVKGQK